MCASDAFGWAKRGLTGCFERRNKNSKHSSTPTGPRRGDMSGVLLFLHLTYYALVVRSYTHRDAYVHTFFSIILERNGKGQREGRGKVNKRSDLLSSSFQAKQRVMRALAIMFYVKIEVKKQKAFAPHLFIHFLCSFFFFPFRSLHCFVSRSSPLCHSSFLPSSSFFFLSFSPWFLYYFHSFSLIFTVSTISFRLLHYISDL